MHGNQGWALLEPCTIGHALDAGASWEAVHFRKSLDGMPFAAIRMDDLDRELFYQVNATMPIPLKVVDHAGLLTAKLAVHVQERTEKLSTFFGRVKRCRVTVDGPGQHALRGRVRVRVHLTLPDSEIEVNRQAGEDLPIAIRESFDAADRRLEDYVRLQKQSSRNEASRRSKKDA